MLGGRRSPLIPHPLSDAGLTFLIASEEQHCWGDLAVSKKRSHHAFRELHPSQGKERQDSRTAVLWPRAKKEIRTSRKDAFPPSRASHGERSIWYLDIMELLFGCSVVSDS